MSSKWTVVSGPSFAELRAFNSKEEAEHYASKIKGPKAILVWKEPIPQGMSKEFMEVLQKDFYESTATREATRKELWADCHDVLPSFPPDKLGPPLPSALTLTAMELFRRGEVSTQRAQRVRWALGQNVLPD